MRLLILAFLLFTGSQAEACLNRITLENARKAIALEPGVATDPNGELCFDGIDWETAELSEVMESVCKVEVTEGETCPEVEQKPTGQFHLMTNLTKKAAKEAREKTRIDAEKKKRDDLELSRKDLKALKNRTSLTNAERDKILIHLLKENIPE